jgi:putative heme-binding domain-containing protein
MVISSRAICLFTLALFYSFTASYELFSAETPSPKIYAQSPEIALVKGQTPPIAEPSTALFTTGPAPSWIWGPDEASNYVVKATFTGTGASAWLRATCDNSMNIYVNGWKVATSTDFTKPEQVDIKKYLKEGENLIEAEVANSGGPAGFVAKIVITGADGNVRYVVTDDKWVAAESREGTTTVAARVISKLEDHPGGKGMLADFSDDVSRGLFNIAPGFQVERLFTVPKEELGSWVCMTTDPKGRLIVSDQGKTGLYRVTPAPIGSQEQTKVEPLDIQIDGTLLTGAHGLLCAFDSLYVVINEREIPKGLYRCRDTNGDDKYDEAVKLHDIPGGGEHGPHALRLSPDGKSIYFDAGNHTHLPFERGLNSPAQTMGGVRAEPLRATLPEGASSRIAPNWDEDLLLPRQWDAGGHAVGILAPCGWIAKTDPDGKTWEVISIGYRNQYDFAFNADGEIFTYDSDMEWDMGSPWYLPTRIMHATSGSEFGSRSGTGRWPEYFVDSLPAVIDIGPGSPVGVEFGYGAKFPAKYQRAFFACDWTFGTMYAVHLEPNGASYKATKEEFISRTPLPLTDLVIAKDGAMYFTVGGRGTQSELYRVTYVGTEPTTPVETRDGRFADLRDLRHSIESYHTASTPNPAKAVEFLLPYLNHSDRHIRYATRVALERLPLELWQDKVLGSTYPEVVITGCVGLARQGEPALQPRILAALGKLELKKLGEPQQLELLRAYQLAFIRLGRPDESTLRELGQRIDAVFPTSSDFVNRELATLMVFLNSPGTLTKILPLLAKEPVRKAQGNAELVARNKQFGGSIETMNANAPDLQQYHYAFVLRNLRHGWTLEDRKTYFSWFEKAHSWSGGHSFQKFLTNIDNEAFDQLSDSERVVLEASGARKPYKAPELPKPVGPGKDWTLDELVELSRTELKGRDFKNGETMYKAARCVVCHRFAGDGGSTGHDLTQAAGRFSFKDLAESIIEPSKVISDQYKTTVVLTKAGKSYTGRIVNASNDSITLLVDPEDSTKLVTIKKDEIEEQSLSAVSLMPKDLLKPLSQNEVMDLMAYLLSRGNAKDPLFRK